MDFAVPKGSKVSEGDMVMGESKGVYMVSHVDVNFGETRVGASMSVCGIHDGIVSDVDGVRSPKLAIISPALVVVSPKMILISSDMAGS